MKRRESRNKFNHNLALLTSLVITIWSFLGAASFDWLGFGQLGIPIIIGGLAYLAVYKAANAESSATVHLVSRGIAILIGVCLLLSSWLAIKGLWISPFDPNINRSAIENTSTGMLMFSVLLAIVLSGLQRDVFWPTKRQPGQLDERELSERRSIFERSYRISIGLTALVLWGYLTTVTSVPAIMQIDGMGLPGHYFIPAYSLLVALFALPLCLAVQKKK